MSKLISHHATETLPSGTTITTLHLTPEGRSELSTNGVTIPPPTAELTAYDHQQRARIASLALSIGSAVAMTLALLGASAVFCASLPFAVYSIPTGMWAWRDLQTLKRRRLARGHMYTDSEPRID